MHDRWQRILAAKSLLGLNDTASVLEIKKAYRRLARARHPDLAPDPVAGQRTMQELNAAYGTLMAYCTTYPIPLRPEEATAAMDPEDWWLDRFGEDPLWGRKRQSK